MSRLLGKMQAALLQTNKHRWPYQAPHPKDAVQRAPDEHRGVVVLILGLGASRTLYGPDGSFHILPDPSSRVSSER